MNQDGGFDCPSCAWPDPDHKRKHAAEFCENGAKAVAWEATRKRVPRAFFAEHSIDADERDLRVRARQARPDHRADAAPGRRDPLRAGRLGRGLPGRRPAPEGAGRPERRRLLHLRPDQQRGRVPLPALRPRLRHQQPARLLEHVPRVIRYGAVAGDRQRQGRGHARDARGVRADRGRRPEPGHQRAPDAQPPRDRQAQRRRDRLGQPAARARPDELQEPAAPDAAGSARARRSPTSICRSGSAATRRCSLPSATFCSRPRPPTRAPCWTRPSSSAHQRVRALRQAQRRARLARGRAGHRTDAGPRSRSSPSDSSSPRRR